MPVASFVDLQEAICGLLGATPPPLAYDENDVMAFHVTTSDVSINFVHRRGMDRVAFVYIALGVLPEDRELKVWRLLAEANFLMLAEHGPSFSRNPVTGQVVLQWVRALGDCDAIEIFQSLARLADKARQWRRTHFLEESDDAPPSGPGLHAANFA